MSNLSNEEEKHTNTITITKDALEKRLEQLLTDLNLIQEGLALVQQQTEHLNAQVIELSERFNRFIEYTENL